MKATQVDLVLAIDCSQSMKPCFDGLVEHLSKLIKPLHGWSFQLRIGVVAMAASKQPGGGVLYQVYGLANGGLSEILYGEDEVERGLLFTSDPDRILQSLRSVTVEGDEDLLLLLDFAADFPFDSSPRTRRVVALFSDERIEDGTAGPEEMALLGNLCKKYMDRRIKLFAALPLSPAAEQLAAIDGSEIEPIEGGDGLRRVDFGKLLGAMAKSISVSSLQASPDERYQRALFGQDSWVDGTGEMTGA
jgi:hypothetical protein